MLSLDKASVKDSFEIHKMQVTAFQELLRKYQDIKTNPGAESIDKIFQRIKQKGTDYYFITLNGKHIGAIRVVQLEDSKSRISPMFILPEFQGKGYAQEALCQIEHLYTNTFAWELDTIKQESKLCHLYEKMGYLPTGKENVVKDGMTIIFYRKNKNK